MTLAMRAFVEYSICEAKHKIEDVVLTAARNGQTQHSWMKKKNENILEFLLTNKFSSV